MKPEWDADGEPLNLEAASQDALEWLRYARSRLALTHDARVRLEACIAGLERMLKEE